MSGWIFQDTDVIVGIRTIRFFYPKAILFSIINTVYSKGNIIKDTLIFDMLIYDWVWYEI